MNILSQQIPNSLSKRVYYICILGDRISSHNLSRLDSASLHRTVVIITTTVVSIARVVHELTSRGIIRRWSRINIFHVESRSEIIDFENSAETEAWLLLGLLLSSLQTAEIGISRLDSRNKRICRGKFQFTASNYFSTRNQFV